MIVRDGWNIPSSKQSKGHHGLIAGEKQYVPGSDSNRSHDPSKDNEWNENNGYK